MLTVASCFEFKIQEGVFRDFGPQNEAVGKNDPPRVLLKFEGGSFELIKKIRKFFHLKIERKWTGNS